MSVDFDAYRYAGTGIQQSPSSSVGVVSSLPPTADGKNPRFVCLKGVTSGVTYVKFMASGSSGSSATVGDIPVNVNETIRVAVGGAFWVGSLSDSGTSRVNIWPIEF